MTHGTMSPALLGLGCFLFAAPALAASDLRVTIPAPAPAHVYDATSYQVVVANIGNQSAAAVTLTVTLPATHTSPTKYVMGTLANVDSRCTKSGTKLVCNLGIIGKNQNKVVTFDIALPEAAETLTVSAAATTTSSENSLANNSASDVPTLLHYATALADGDALHNRHCTGTGLTSFFECELFPSSISFHDVVVHGDGTVSIPDEPGFSGTWSQPTPDTLLMTYLDGQTVVAEFEGYGTAPGCFEGITTFPGSTYVSPYEVCVSN